MNESEHKLTRIGVFYDGNFFAHVSNYYRYHHDRKARIRIGGLHEFVRAEVANREGVDQRYCQVVDAHYFRGRLPAEEAEARDLLRGERQFDDALIREGVVTHYLPLSPSKGETGIDIWLALEAHELAIYKRFNVAVLVAGDGDYVPLVRKLNTLGTRVMVLGWDFEYRDERTGEEKRTWVNQALLNEVTYPIVMSNVIEDRSRRRDALVKNLFLPTKKSLTGDTVPASARAEHHAPTQRGVILNLLDGYGFISPDGGGENVFFFHADVLNRDFDELERGEVVEYVIGENEKGPAARRIAAIGHSADKTVLEKLTSG